MGGLQTSNTALKVFVDPATYDVAEWILDWELIARLKPFHVWREDVIRERFNYGEQRGLQCAFGRTYRLEIPWTFANRASFGGCRSWLTLPEFPGETVSMHPVLNDDEHAEATRKVQSALSGDDAA